MRRIEMTWSDGEWDDGVADELVAEMMEGLEKRRRVLPDVVKVVIDWGKAGTTREVSISKLDQPQAVDVQIHEDWVTEEDKAALVRLLREAGFSPVNVQGKDV